MVARGAGSGYRRWLWRGLAGVAALAVLAGAVHLLIREYDPARIAYKRLTAHDRYVYDAVDPKLRETDPATLIDPVLVRDPAAARRRLAVLVWGADAIPADLAPQTVEQDVTEPTLGDLGEDVRVDRLYLDMDLGVHAIFFHMHAPRPNGRLVLYHHGFGDPIAREAPLFRALLAAGYDVMAFNMRGNAGNSGLARPDPDSREVANLTSEMARFDRPLRFHLAPVVAGIDHALATGDYSSVDMIGLSMGGFIAILAAAADPRIERSYPVAADLPLYLRTGQEVLPGYPPYYAPLVAAFSHPDLYVLGASGKGRAQVQFFNRYDRCCYHGLRGTVYEKAVADAVAATPEGGRFDVRLDETHADHKISDFTIAALLADLSRGR